MSTPAHELPPLVRLRLIDAAASQFLVAVRAEAYRVGRRVSGVRSREVLPGTSPPRRVRCDATGYSANARWSDSGAFRRDAGTAPRSFLPTTLHASASGVTRRAVPPRLNAMSTMSRSGR